jgi:hypothetical protein
VLITAVVSGIMLGERLGSWPKVLRDTSTKIDQPGQNEKQIAQTIQVCNKNLPNLGFFLSEPDHPTFCPATYCAGHVQKSRSPRSAGNNKVAKRRHAQIVPVNLPFHLPDIRVRNLLDAMFLRIRSRKLSSYPIEFPLHSPEHPVDILLQGFGSA